MHEPVYKRVKTAFLGALDENVAESCKRVAAAEIAFYKNLPPAAAAGAFKRAFEATAEDLGAEAPLAFPALLSAIGVQRSGSGVVISDILRGMAIGFEVASDRFSEMFHDDPDARVFWEQSRSRISFMGAAALADSYLAAREKVVSAQAEEITKLSIRVLPLYPGILVLPLVGRLDAARAGAMTLVLLEAIVANGSEVVILDVTGLPFVDADMASHLLGAAQAAELVGAKPILVGVSPAMAKTMVDAGVELGRLVTRSNLATGLGHALRVLGKSIVDG